MLLVVIQTAIFVVATGWIMGAMPDAGMAPGAIGMVVTYALTVWPVKIMDWVRSRVRLRPAAGELRLSPKPSERLRTEVMTAQLPEAHRRFLP